MKARSPGSAIELFLRLPSMLAGERSPATSIAIGAVFGASGFLCTMFIGFGIVPVVFWVSGVFAIINGVRKIHVAPVEDSFARARLDAIPLPVSYCFECKRVLSHPSERCVYCSSGGECFQVQTELDRRLALTRISAEEKRSHA